VAIGAIARGKTRIGTESAARNLRYEFLRRTAESIGARYILMGHTADDQAETVLHNICRGTGLAGVAGIRFTRRINEAVTVVRPFLDVWRSEILSYLDHINQTYRTDSSNQSTMYTRNRIRHDVLPRLEEEINRSTRKHLVQLAQLAREASEELDRAASQLDSAIIRQTETELWLDLEKFAESSEFLIVQFLKRCWGWQEWPMRSMDSTKWQTLASGIRRASSSDGFPTIRLPGSVFATFVPNVVRFRRDTETS
jgi:tRNA(Ile)-lysidine synthase